MSELEKPGISRRDFLRAAGTLGISGGLLGAYAGQAHGLMSPGRQPSTFHTAGTALWVALTPRGSTRPGS